MFEDDDAADPQKRPFDPAERATAKSDEFRMHAELAAVFEGPRKFEAEIDFMLDASAARQFQQTIGKLEKQRVTDTPLLAPDAFDAAKSLLDAPATHALTTNDYHVSRRPGEVVIVRWLAGAQVESFYERLQAHFDAALRQFVEDERQAYEWRQDETMTAYLEKLGKIEVKMSERYLRPILLEHPLFALSTQAADEIDITYLCDRIMNVPASEVVGTASTPEDGSEAARAWYFKLFSLRGSVDGEERLCFVTYLQKTGDDWS